MNARENPMVDIRKWVQIDLRELTPDMRLDTKEKYDAFKNANGQLAMLLVEFSGHKVRVTFTKIERGVAKRKVPRTVNLDADD